jgi:hypothetical protein
LVRERERAPVAVAVGRTNFVVHQGLAYSTLAGRRALLRGGRTGGESRRVGVRIQVRLHTRIANSACLVGTWTHAVGVSSFPGSLRGMLRCWCRAREWFDVPGCRNLFSSRRGVN